MRLYPALPGHLLPLFQGIRLRKQLQTEQIQRKHRCFANAVLLQVSLKPIQRHFIQRQLHQPQAHLIDGEIMKAAVLAETDQTATRVYPREPFLRPFVEE